LLNIHDSLTGVHVEKGGEAHVKVPTTGTKKAWAEDRARETTQTVPAQAS